MAVAMIYPEPEGRGRGKKGSVSERFPEISKGKVSEARTVLKHAPDLAGNVLAQSRPGRRTARSRLPGYPGAPEPGRAPRAAPAGT